MRQKIVQYMGLMSLLICVVGTARAQDRNAEDLFAKDPLAKALRADNVFVGRTRQNTVDIKALRTLTQRTSQIPLKIAVLSQLPPSGSGFKTRDNYTKQLHDYLKMGRGALIIVTEKGVSMATDALPAAQITQILQQNSPQIQSDPVYGLQQTVQALDAAGQNAPNTLASPAQDTPNPQPASDSGIADLWWVLPVGALGGLALWAGNKSAKKRRAIKEAQAPVERLRGEVVTGITYADTYLDLLPASPEATAARDARRQAADLYEQAAGLARRAHDAADWGRAQALLEQAKREVDVCKQKIDVATGGTGLAVAVEGTDYRATPGSFGKGAASQAAPVISGLRIEDIPLNERAACFFCSRPARTTDLTPVDVAINGQRRKVLACADDVRIIQHGATPEIRTIQANGQRVPWYSSRQYDPYRDYYSTQVIYSPAYGGPYGYDGGFTEGLLIGSLLSEPYPMAYPVFVDPQGIPTNDPQMAIPQMGDGGGQSDFGGADFYGSNAGDFGMGGGDFGSSDPGVGGVDFGGATDTSTSTDFGSADFGGGGSSWGGSDSGGSDFGGGDFGGGGDSGGGGDF